MLKPSKKQPDWLGEYYRAEYTIADISFRNLWIFISAYNKNEALEIAAKIDELKQYSFIRLKGPLRWKGGDIESDEITSIPKKYKI